MTKRYSYFKSEITGLFVISDELHKETFSGMEDEYNCSRIVRKLNTLTKENEQLKSSDNITDLETEVMKLKEENKQLKQYKQSVSEILLYWSQKDLTAKQLQVVIAIMEELNIYGDVE